MVSSVQFKQAKTPVLRKIFRQGKVFVCGICRSKHSQRKDANNCLNHCWYALQEQYPLIVRTEYGKTYFRCQYCFRDYTSENDGLDCAVECIDKKRQHHIKEQLIQDLPIETRPRKQFQLVKVPQLAPAGISFRKQKEETPPEPEIEENTEVENDQEPEESVEPEKKKRHRSEYKKEWIRAAAKYKCMYCLELHYTRMEVQDCFNSHFDQEGYELEASGDPN